jgi:hypothetical protein
MFGVDSASNRLNCCKLAKGNCPRPCDDRRSCRCEGLPTRLDMQVPVRPPDPDWQTSRRAFRWLIDAAAESGMTRIGSAPAVRPAA